MKLVLRFNGNYDDYNVIHLVNGNLRVLPIIFPLETEDVSVGENDGYVIAGYDHHKGECRLLLLPTFLIHLIIWPSR